MREEDEVQLVSPRPRNRARTAWGQWVDQCSLAEWKEEKRGRGREKTNQVKSSLGMAASFVSNMPVWFRSCVYLSTEAMS